MIFHTFQYPDVKCDPLLRYIFLECVEGLSCLLKHAKMEGLIRGISILRQAPIVSHLLYADDSLLFTRASVQECDAILNILSRYEGASGQQINLDKLTVLFSSNTPQHVRDVTLNHLGFSKTMEKDRYLGLPVMLRRVKTRVSSFEGSSMALLAKQCWRLVQGEDTLCHRVFKAKYFPHCSSGNLGHNPSFVWTNLMEGRRILDTGSR